ncbi:FxSxx-COOH system tetratricopeptide repeat protein [Microbispora triticiradicis]|uniref:FxSxx-COOH system tetratricopeptide repeat protein n=1 Tax=Microbispora triticiradicis TaxID=2200763 RepID=UPI001AD6295D|nr:FxSxx-COOH system tetratricopeptide repeat protein [Microbispora triticiradicis]MBO4273002.1 tetratricopeptide repeat protein [Microbispora triticiradicis]
MDHRVPPYLGRIVDSADNSIGTCFQIAPGLLVTAAHVLRGTSTVRFAPLGGGPTSTGMLLRVDEQNDLAVFQADLGLAAAVTGLAATDEVTPFTPLLITGAVEVLDPGHVYHHLEAPGHWHGVVSRDEILLARVKTDAVLPGMSGAPVRRLTDEAVIGVVSGRYNSADGWLAHSVWITRTEHLRDLLADVHPLKLRAGRPSTELASVRNVGPRNRAFVGREDHLAVLQAQLAPEKVAVITAVHGIGGVGKTQLALEYCHRFRDNYDVVWWVHAEHPSLIADQLARLARQAGWVEPELETASAAERALATLATSDRWLIVYDNAEDPQAIAPWLLDGPGHTLITSRNPDWAEVSVRVPVELMHRAESILLLRRHQPSLTKAEAETLAEQLGDLPVALAQAGGFMATAACPAAEYQRLLGTQAAGLMRQAKPMSYPVSLAAAIDLSLEHLRTADLAALGVLRACSLLAPVPIPTRLFSSSLESTSPQPVTASDELTALRSLQGEPLAALLSIGVLTRYGLATPQQAGLQVHRLVQAVVRDGLTIEQRHLYRHHVESLVAAVRFEDPNDAATWADWANLLPHVLAVDPAATDSPELRYLAGNAAWYLVVRGDLDEGLRLSSHLYHRWKERLGPDDVSTMSAASVLAACYAEQGDFATATQINHDNLVRRLRLLGPTHLDTLDSMVNLAATQRGMDQLEEARRLGENALASWREVFGPDHQRTLNAERELAETLLRLGETQRATELLTQTHERHLRVLGPDHRLTLQVGHNMARELRAAGHIETALSMYESVLQRSSAVLGEGHPDTLRTLAAIREMREAGTSLDVDGRQS